MPERTAATLTAVEARVNDIVVPATLRVDVESLKPSNSTIYGVRAGPWFDWFGIAVDVATLDPDVKRQTIRATANLRFDEEVFGEEVTIDPAQAVSVDIPRVTVPTTATAAALAMVRVPGGSAEPYAFAGPVYLVTNSDLGGDWGLRAGGGIRLPLSRRVALFGEYRYTTVDAEAFVGRVRGSTQGVEGSTGRIRAAVDIRNHSAIGGVSFSF